MLFKLCSQVSEGQKSHPGKIEDRRRARGPAIKSQSSQPDQRIKKGGCNHFQTNHASFLSLIPEVA